MPTLPLTLLPRAVLASHSSFLHSLLVGREEEEAVLILPDFTPAEVEEVVQVAQLPSPLLPSVQFLYGRLEEVGRPGPAFACLRVSSLPLARKEEAVEGLEVDSPDSLAADSCVGSDPTSEKPFYCKLCPAAGRDKYKLAHNARRHVANVHFKLARSAKRWRCTACGGTYASRDGLRKHQQLHCRGPASPPKAAGYRCAECGEEFATMDTVEEHMEGCTGQQADTAYQCSLCGEDGLVVVIPTLADFRNHMAEQHGEVGFTEVQGEVREEKDVEGVNSGVLEESVPEEEVEEVKSEEVVIGEILLEEMVMEETIVVEEGDVLLQQQHGGIGTTEVFVQSEGAALVDENCNLAEATSPRHRCSVCRNEFGCSRQLEEHMGEHPTCTVCYSRLLSNAAYSRHLAEHPQCGQCGAICAGAPELAAHIDLHLEEHCTSTAAYQHPEVREAIYSIQPDLQQSQRSSRPATLQPKPSSTQPATAAFLPAARLLRGVMALANPGLEVEVGELGQQVAPEEGEGGPGGLVEVQQEHSSPRTRFSLRMVDTEQLSVKCQFCPSSFSSWESLTSHTAVAHAALVQEVEEAPVEVQEAVRKDPSQLPFYCLACNAQFSKMRELLLHADSDHPVTFQDKVRTDPGDKSTS